MGQNITSGNGQRVFVTGGTGFIGKELVKSLLAREYHVTVYTRQSLRSSNPNLFYVHSLDEIMAIKPNIIINLAGETISKRWSPTYKKAILESRVALTNKLVGYVSQMEVKPSLFISGSAIGVYGNSSDLSFTESSIINRQPSLFSQQLCLSWEEAALKATESQIRTVLLRTGVVLGKEGGILQKLSLPFLLGLGGKIGSGTQMLSWIDRRDLIQMIHFIIENEAISGPVNAVSPSPVNNEDFSKQLAKTLHRPCIFPMPSVVAKVVFGQMAQELMLTGQKVLPKVLEQNHFKFSYPTLEQSLNSIYQST